MKSKESFVIQGLAGKKSLKGKVKIHGAKNAALKAMAASILFDGPVSFENIPDTADVETISDILTKLGAKVTKKSGNAFIIDPSSIKSNDIDVELGKSMRTSVVLTGPLLARYGKVSLPAPGGCVIGARPIDLFIEGYSKLGATTKENKDFYNIEAKGGLKGAVIEFKRISVGATETLMMAAVLAKGTTTLHNCALEPEIVNVAEWLNSCGADIHGVGTPTITIKGTGGVLLKPKKTFITIPDRIEAGSFLILGALCAEELTIENCEPAHMEAVIGLLKDSGVPIELRKNGEIRIANNAKPNSPFKAFNIITREYPGFPTDLQAPIAVYLTQSQGESTIKENIFEGRFKYVEDLKKMGADISIKNPQEISIKGPIELHALADGEELQAHDIRAGFAVVLAALLGKGKSTVNNVHLIDRGYERLEEQLKSLGADIKRISN